MKSIVKLFYICIIALIIPLLFSCKKIFGPTDQEIEEQITELISSDKFESAYEMAEKSSDNSDIYKYKISKSQIKFILDNMEGEEAANEIKFIIIDKLDDSSHRRQNAYVYAIELSEIRKDDVLTSLLKQSLLETSINRFLKEGAHSLDFEYDILRYVKNFPESFDVEKFKKENVK